MRVSAVLATFNGAAYVEELIDSLLNSTRPPDEWVVIDDCSSDNTTELVARRLSGIPHVRQVVNDRNLGAAGSFIRGALMSTGDVVFFVDQDDVWFPDRIDRMTAAFGRTNGLVMAYCDGYITNARLEKGGGTIFSTRKRAQLSAGAERPTMDIAGNPDIKGCTAAFEGTFLRNLFATSDSRFARYWGHDHWSALFAYGTGRVDVVAEPLFLHRFHGNNTSGAVKFNPWSLKHINKYMKAVRSQEPEHFVNRYRLAIAHAELQGSAFAPGLLDALHQFQGFAEQRLELRSMGFLGRVRASWELYRRGIYREHFNGTATWIRDAFL